MVESLVKISGKDIKINWDISKPSGDLKRLMDTTKQEKHDLLPQIDFYDALLKTYSYYTNQFTKNKIDLNVRNFLTDGGFYVGKIDNLILNHNEHENIILDIRKTCETKEYFGYRYDYNLPDSFKGDLPNKKLHYTKEESNELEKLVRDSNGREIQTWWETHKYDDNLSNGKRYFQNLIEGFIFDIYPDLKDNILHQDAFTIYEEGDHITPHNDGENSARYCVVLIYLSDEKDYNNNGGKLVINESGQTLEILPIKNNFSMLDFTLNNPDHSVSPVTGNFRRITYVDFIHNKKMVNFGRKDEIKGENNKII
jgi:hypothetical protein